jgi:hypothetical protein
MSTSRLKEKMTNRRHTKKKGSPQGTGRVAQVVVYLLSKCEALSSNPSTEKKGKLSICPRYLQTSEDNKRLQTP